MHASRTLWPPQPPLVWCHLRTRAAVKEVFALACQEGSSVNVTTFDKIFKEEGAFAFAQVCLRNICSCPREECLF
jgi:hypothetical protein